MTDIATSVLPAFLSSAFLLLRLPRASFAHCLNIGVTLFLSISGYRHPSMRVCLWAVLDSFVKVLHTGALVHIHHRRTSLWRILMG
jgi:hypothetical protein